MKLDTNRWAHTRRARHASARVRPLTWMGGAAVITALVLLGGLVAVLTLTVMIVARHTPGRIPRERSALSGAAVGANGRGVQILPDGRPGAA